MQKYTELKFRELKSQFDSEREEMEAKISAFLAPKGLVYSSAHIDHLLKDNFAYIENLFDKLFETEKRALSHIQTTFPDDYFTALEKELTELILKELDMIRYRLLKIFQKYSSHAESRIDLKINQKENFYKESINIAVEKLKEELMLGMLKPSYSTTIHIEGDVGAINTGTVYGLVQGEIKKIRGSDDKRIAELFGHLLDAVNNAAISDTVKTEKMQNIELLVQQYNKPKKERNYGLINASLSFLSAAADISTLWSQYGQTIIDIFK